MTQKFELRPKGDWEFVEHRDGATFRAEAVLMTEVMAEGRGQPCEIRLTEEDIVKLLSVPQLQEIAARLQQDLT